MATRRSSGRSGAPWRKLPASLGRWTAGVLVQSNYGGILQILGVPVGRELGQYSFKGEVEQDAGHGSIMIVVATDAPLSDRNLRRLATRALLGLGHTGSFMGNGSGDFVIAFATHPAVRRPVADPALRNSLATARRELGNPEMSALFEAVAESTEEAIYSRLGTVEALPLDRVMVLLRKYRAVER